MTLKRRIRSILLITPFFSPNIGGVETHLRDLCDYLGKEGDNISVVTYQPLVTRVRASSKEDRRGLMIRRISWFGHGLFDRLEPYPFLELAYLLPGLFFWTLIFILSHKRRVDVIYTHGLVASLVGRLIKPILRRPMVATIHTIYYLGSKPTLGRILTWILKPYDKVLFVSERIREEFVGSGLDAGKTAVFTYWADQSRFKPMDKQRARKMLHWNEEFTVLFVGRLIREKGVGVLIDAARRVCSGVRFVFVTSGTYQEFESLAGKDLPSSVVYVGPVAYDKLHYYYNAADLFVLPSQHREGFSRAVLEAALCGTPVLASNIGCLPDIVDPKIGDLVDPPTPENFARIIQHYFDNHLELDQLTSGCAEYARVRFSTNNAEVIEQSFDVGRIN